MFGFGKKKAAATTQQEEAKSSGNGKRSATDIDKELAKLGIFATPPGDDIDDDGDLENELLALLSDDDISSHSPRKQARSPRPQQVQPIHIPLPATPIQHTSSPVVPKKPKVPPPPQSTTLFPSNVGEESAVPATESVPVVPSDQPDLTSDLISDLFKASSAPHTVIEALNQRLIKYKSEVDKANETSNSSKARRMGRIVKQYEDAISAHKKGKLIVYSELPTPPGFPPIPGQAAPAPINLDALPGLDDSPPTLGPSLSLDRKPATPIQIQRASSPVAPKKPSLPPPRQSTTLLASTDGEVSVVPGTGSASEVPSCQPDLISDLPSDLFKAPSPPRSVIEALNQRLIKYKSEVDKANETSNSSKARRMGRIVKQYEDAINAHKNGKPIVFEELPAPPGFPPIPGQVAAPPLNLDSLPGLQDVASPDPTVGKVPSATGVSPGKPAVGGPSIVRGGTKSGGKLTLQEKQLSVILARQKQFRSAAINAKQRGDLDQARELLRTAKGFDKLVQVSQAGLPVDMNTLPSAPDAIAALESEDFEVVTASDCIPATTSAADVFVKLEEDLKEQLKVCMRTREHYKGIGDIASANRFENLALDSKRDLDALRLAARKGDTLPSYHYETRIFSITECNSDVLDDEIEVNVLKGINYKAGSPTDTFVKVELAYPSAEQAQTNRSGVVQDAEYAAIYKLNINRKAKNFHRFVHRHGVKVEVWSKGGIWFGLRQLFLCRRGFLRSSTLMGTAMVKLLPLETKCTIHEAFDILEGRKSIGKLEVKVRIREPILTKQITQKKQKWLSIDRT